MEFRYTRHTCSLSDFTLLTPEEPRIKLLQLLLLLLQVYCEDSFHGLSTCKVQVAEEERTLNIWVRSRERRGQLSGHASVLPVRPIGSSPFSLKEYMLSNYLSVEPFHGRKITYRSY